MTINFPWGSLLRGVLGHDDATLAGIARLLAPRATAEILVSVTPRDGVPGTAADLADIYAAHGLELAEARPASTEEITASRSSWAKRLRAGTARPVTRLTACRATNTGPRS
jgi:16S rRNA (adenine(1408)-N(1))-methyltransferase